MMKQKYQRTNGEKVLGVINKISEYSTKDKMEIVLDTFGNMVNEVKRIELVKKFEYVLYLQFLERLEQDEKINAQ